MNYKESLISGDSWVRCSNIQIINPLNINTNIVQKPNMVFQEDEIVLINGNVIPIKCSHLYKEFNPTESINLINSDTGQPTGEVVTHQKLYEILFSLYMQTALARDAAQASQV